MFKGGPHHIHRRNCLVRHPQVCIQGIALGGRDRPHDDIAWGLPNTVSHKEQARACSCIMIEHGTCIYTDCGSVASYWKAQLAGETYPGHMYCC